MELRALFLSNDQIGAFWQLFLLFWQVKTGKMYSDQITVVTGSDKLGREGNINPPSIKPPSVINPDFFNEACEEYAHASSLNLREKMHAYQKSSSLAGENSIS